MPQKLGCRDLLPSSQPTGHRNRPILVVAADAAVGEEKQLGRMTVEHRMKVAVRHSRARLLVNAPVGRTGKEQNPWLEVAA